MGNSAPRFSRLSNQEVYNEKPNSQILSFEMLPARKGKESDSSGYQREEPFLLHHSPGHIAPYWQLILLCLFVLVVTVILTSIATVLISSFFMKDIFVSKAKFDAFVNQSHAHMHCMERLDAMEELYNDSVMAYKREIDALKGQIIDILSAQAEMKKDIKDVQNGTAQQDNDILELVQYNISVIARKIGAMEDSIRQASKQDDRLLSDRLSQLKGQLEHLNKEIHQPVNLYRHCKEDTRHCTIAPEQSRQYWRDCATMYLPLKVEGWETMHYQCMYHSSSTENMEVLTPFEDNGQLRCDCDVTYPGDGSERHNPVDRDIHATCTLTILRCPLSQSVFE